jgi:ADP-ribose pyrophosphatase YjhB (NUDIX family)
MKVKRNGEIFAYTAAGGVVLDQTGEKVLLLNRPSRDEVRLPKGHVEPGETLSKAALRDVMEESGYADIIMLKDLGEQIVAFQFNGQHIQRTEHYFLMRIRSNRLQLQPKVDSKQFFAMWMDWDEACDVITFDAEREWLARARIALEEI